MDIRANRKAYRIGLPFIVVCAVFASSCSSLRILPPGATIHHDDFEYGVAEYAAESSVGEGEFSARPAGRFLVVKFSVANKARRVSHAWSDATVYAEDENGRRYKNVVVAQAALLGLSVSEIPAEHLTGPGETETAVLVFDVPADALQTVLGVRGSFLMGDLFDLGSFARSRIALY